MAADPLAPFRENPDRSALVFDVDGTLAPIVARPELARVPFPTRALLANLTARYAFVAFLSGRSSEDARRVVGLKEARYVGNHGLDLEPRAHELAGELAAFRDAIGLDVEDKHLTLTYHFREAEDEGAARSQLETVAERARAAGLVPHWGRKILEIRPPVEADKGTAVRALLAEAKARNGLYAGDDVTDLDAFHGLETAGLDHAVRVAVLSAEGPPGLAERADLVVESPEQLATLLARL